MIVANIVDNSKFINQFYCKNCKKATKSIFKCKDDKGNKLTYCDSCVPDDIKSRAIKINQKQELI